MGSTVSHVSMTCLERQHTASVCLRAHLGMLQRGTQLCSCEMPWAALELMHDDKMCDRSSPGPAEIAGIMARQNCGSYHCEPLYKQPCCKAGHSGCGAPREAHDIAFRVLACVACLNINVMDGHCHVSCTKSSTVC